MIDGDFIQLEDYLASKIRQPNYNDEALVINANGILRLIGIENIAGKEHYGRRTKGKMEVWRQSWLCAQDTEYAHKLLSKVQPHGMALISGDEDLE